MKSQLHIIGPAKSGDGGFHFMPKGCEHLSLLVAAEGNIEVAVVGAACQVSTVASGGFPHAGYICMHFVYIAARLACRYVGTAEQDVCARCRCLGQVAGVGEAFFGVSS